MAAGHVGTPLLDKGIVAVGELGNKIVGAGQLTGVDQLLVGGVQVAPTQIFFNGAGKQHVLLQHHRHLAAQGIQIVFTHVYPTHLYGAFGGIVQPGDQLDQGGLAAAGAADDPHRLAGRNL